MKFPQEIEDIIFLYADIYTLENCRELQSDFVKTTTQYNYNKDTLININNVKWLKCQDYLWIGWILTVKHKMGL